MISILASSREAGSSNLSLEPEDAKLLNGSVREATVGRRSRTEAFAFGPWQSSVITRSFGLSVVRARLPIAFKRFPIRTRAIAP